MLRAAVLGQPFLLQNVRTVGGVAAIGGLVLAVVSLLINVGQFYWFMLAERGHHVTLDDFMRGISHFFWRFLGLALLSGLLGAVAGGLFAIAFIPMFRVGMGLNAFITPLLAGAVGLAAGVCWVAGSRLASVSQTDRPSCTGWRYSPAAQSALSSGYW